MKQVSRRFAFVILLLVLALPALGQTQFSHQRQRAFFKGLLYGIKGAARQDKRFAVVQSLRYQFCPCDFTHDARGELSMDIRYEPPVDIHDATIIPVVVVNDESEEGFRLPAIMKDGEHWRFNYAKLVRYDSKEVAAFWLDAYTLDLERRAQEWFGRLPNTPNAEGV